MSGELFAVIKRSSKYAHQQPLQEGGGRKPAPFRVEVAAAAGHNVYGNNNQYRLEDLNFFVKVGAGFVRLS